MTTPFPGMDPYLESPAYWPDFHQRFITHWSEWLLDHLPDHYDVLIEERITRIEAGGRTDFRPDVAISQTYPLPTEIPGDGPSLDREPVTVRVTMLDEEAESYLRILHRADSSLVTVLELLSPSNKVNPGRREYLSKRHEVLRDPVHLVELDLLLEGRRPPMDGPLPPGDYYAIVSRSDLRPECEVYAWTLRDALPRIRIPLKPPDPDVVFDLPGLFAQAYQRGRYARRVRYQQPPAVALAPEQADWARDRVAAWKP
ncbi:MAG: DUF4058 family protein [Gemmataceae bacterium]